mmetsp:Transcript_5894/g.18150  ORF Transcript_5894/g.18150 Transcript_5894/m.18150 type:complete len:264 (-) Transcript_5894:122-913(-)
MLHAAAQAEHEGLQQQLQASVLLPAKAPPEVLHDGGNAVRVQLCLHPHRVRKQLRKVVKAVGADEVVRDVLQNVPVVLDRSQRCAPVLAVGQQQLVVVLRLLLGAQQQHNLHVVWAHQAPRTAVLQHRGTQHLRRLQMLHDAGHGVTARQLPQPLQHAQRRRRLRRQNAQPQIALHLVGLQVWQQLWDARQESWVQARLCADARQLEARLLERTRARSRHAFLKLQVGLGLLQLICGHLWQAVCQPVSAALGIAIATRGAGCS